MSFCATLATSAAALLALPANAMLILRAARKSVREDSYVGCTQ